MKIITAYISNKAISDKQIRKWNGCSFMKDIRYFLSVLFNFAPSKNVSKDNLLVKSKLPESCYLRSTDDNR